ncbi:hypothetical protein HH303_15145 [Rhodospirillaceae bacterium KN72]|uniref:Uncharacterized protein n=1 Tax=Pacificispira spongiicola TaxID=2729598 RepID=A0A7Y0HFF7_9PROT|nr:hypothetical protein [Pacificispira spongiicola]NMM45831.1 hypothetical protein [Pacificispira spongiicola]
MIVVDYGNYRQVQAEWADGLIHAAEWARRANPKCVSPDFVRDLDLAAGDARARLSSATMESEVWVDL